MLNRLWLCLLLLVAVSQALAISEDGLGANTEARRAELLPAAGAAGYVVFPVSPMLKARPEQLPPGAPDEDIRLDAARGEAESLQLLVVPLRRDLREVEVSAAWQETTQPAPVLELERVQYIPVEHPTAEGFKRPGRYPDALFPLTPFAVPLGNAQAVWLTVRVPVETPPGEYRGGVRIAPRGARATELPLTVTVHHVALPVPGYLRSLVLVYDGVPWYKDKWPQALDRMFQRLLEERFTPTWLGVPWEGVFVQVEGKWTARWEAFDAAVDGWLKKGATTFWLPTEPFGVGLGLSNDPAVMAAAAAKFELLDQHLVAKGWEGRFYSYSFDEPPPDQVPTISRYCAFVREHAPHVMIPIVSAIHALEGTGTAWVPHIHELGIPDHAAFLARQRLQADELWMYTCVGTRWIKDPDTWRIDNYGASHRAVGWLLWKYGCQGYLYWNASLWKTGETLYDPLTNPAIVNDTKYPNGHCNGDGFLFYPDPKGQDMPYPSMRLALTRDGFEDYDLLRLLEERVRKVRSNFALHEQVGPEKLRAGLDRLNPDALIRSVEDYERDPAAYEKAHRELLETLDLLGQ